MRLLRIVAIGGLAFLSWVFSTTAAGLAATAAFVATPLMAALTVGAVVVQFAKGGQLQTRAGSHDCSSCRQSIGQIGALWMCAICDQAPIKA